MTRLKKIAITAMKQSLKTKIPIIDPIINIEDFLNSCNTDNRFICYLSNDKSHMFDNKIQKDKDISQMVQAFTNGVNAYIQSLDKNPSPRSPQHVGDDRRGSFRPHS